VTINLGIDPETNKPLLYTGGTVTTSGSAVIPEYNPSVYRNIANYNVIFKDDPEERKEFNRQIRDFYIEQLKKDAKLDEDTYRSQKRYGIAIFIIVVVLVVAGVVFSIVQLSNALKYSDFSQLLTSIEIQKAGNLVVSTSLIGAFVLIVSIVFFFLFLQYVYKPNNKRRDFFDNIKDLSRLMESK
jgi:hypothetical protein